jgi:hypothetical protein
MMYASPILAKSLNEALVPPPGLAFCKEPVPMDIPDVRERFEKEMLLSLWDRPQVFLWLKRAQRYFPYISQQLRDNNMPEDLKFLAIAESALRPHAGSPKGAIGFWQMLPETARNYGLTVDNRVDQRRELQASTRAAIDYLKDLHGQFSSWTLAVAAYNMGEQGLEAEILEQDVKDYYKLYLPLETQRFVFRILSAKIIFSDPVAHGFDLQPDDLYDPLIFETVEVTCFQEVPIRVLAQAAETYFKVIKDLNPQLRGHYVQEGRHTINVPKGGAKGYHERFESLLATYSKARHDRVYTVRSGDSLSSIANKFDVPLPSIIIWNRIDMKKPIQPGDRLILHPRQLQDVKP